MRPDRMLICISSSDAAWSRPRCPRAAQEMSLFEESNNTYETEKRRKDEEAKHWTERRDGDLGKTGNILVCP